MSTKYRTQGDGSPCTYLAFRHASPSTGGGRGVVEVDGVVKVEPGGVGPARGHVDAAQVVVVERHHVGVGHVQGLHRRRRLLLLVPVLAAVLNGHQEELGRLLVGTLKNMKMINILNQCFRKDKIERMQLNSEFYLDVEFDQCRVR